MQTKELIGKKVTNIYILFGTEQGWLDTADTFVELDNSMIIGIPFNGEGEVWERELEPGAESIFKDLSDIPTYHVNKEGKSIDEIAAAHNKRKRTFINRLRKVLFGYEPPIKEYAPYKIEYHENGLKHLLNRTITDILWYEDDTDHGYIELDNGYLFTYNITAPKGTGMAGLHYFKNAEEVKERKGEDIRRLPPSP